MKRRKGKVIKNNNKKGARITSFTIHHRFPIFLCEKFGVNPDHPGNFAWVTSQDHDAFNRLFGGHPSPEEAIQRLITDWLPPPEIALNFIKNPLLRQYYKEFWDSLYSKKLKDLKCEICGGDLSEVKGQEGVFYCVSCNKEFHFHHCMICHLPGSLEVNPNKGLYICYSCLLKVLNRGPRSLRKCGLIRRYYHVLLRLYRRLHK